MEVHLWPNGRRAGGPCCFVHSALKHTDGERVASCSCTGPWLATTMRYKAKMHAGIKEDRAARRMLFNWRTAVQQLQQQWRRTDTTHRVLFHTINHGGKEPPHLSHSPQICSVDDGLQSIKTISLRSAGIHAAPPSNHPYIFHIVVYVFGKDRERTGATDSPSRFGGGGVCVRVHVRFVRATLEDESGGADKNQFHLTDRAAHHQRRHAAVSAE